MKHPLTRFLFWTPRILGILVALFIGLFALDVFSETRGLWETVLALVIHLIPTFVILAGVAVAWRREWVGGVLFVVLGALYIIIAWGRFPWVVYLMISGPLFLVGLFFFLNWMYRAQIRPKA